jgi:hypothetical protein
MSFTVALHKDADMFFMAPLENNRVAEAMYSRGVRLLSKLMACTFGDLVDACKNKPPVNLAPLQAITSMTARTLIAWVHGSGETLPFFLLTLAYLAST